MPATRKSLNQIIAELEARNSLGKQDADSLRTAPRWSLSGAEITGYLGIGIIALGITWTTIAVVQDLDQLTTYIALYVFGTVALAAARWLQSRGIRSAQVAEALFGIGVGSLAAAIGLTLNDVGLLGSTSAAIASAIAVMVGLITCRRTIFVGTLIVVAAVHPLVMSIGETLDLSESVFPLMIVLAGALLVLLGLQPVGSAVVARAAGSASIVFGSIVFAIWRESNFRSIISIAICATLFYIGARRINLEIIVGGGIGITFAIGILMGRTFDSVVLQGAVVTATGAAISALSFVIVRRGDVDSA